MYIYSKLKRWGAALGHQVSLPTFGRVSDIGRVVTNDNPGRGGIRATIEPLPDLECLATMWRGLEARADATFFLSWSWIGTWLELSGAQPLLMVARHGAKVVALGLLQVQTTRIGPVRLHTLYLHQAGDNHFDCITIEFNDFLLDRSCQDEARHACLEELLRVRRTKAIRWRKMYWAGATAAVAPSLSAADLRVRVYRTAPSPCLDIGLLRREGHDHLEMLSRNTRYTIRRSMRLYEEACGPLSIAAAASVEESMLWLSELRRLHQAYWEAKGKPGAFGKPFFSSFLSKLVAGSANRNVDLLRISAGGKPFGYLCNFVYGGSVMNYQSGFLYSSDGRYKPGLVSHALAVRHYIEMRPDAQEYSFLAGDARYKKSLSTTAKQLNWYVIRPG